MAIAPDPATDFINTLESVSAPTVYVSMDDSTTSKDKDTKALAGVDWHHDQESVG